MFFRRFELLSHDKNSHSITDSIYIATKKDKSLDVQSNCTTIIRFIGSSDSSTNLDAFDQVVLITGICEQIVTTRCSDEDVGSPIPFPVLCDCSFFMRPADILRKGIPKAIGQV